MPFFNAALVQSAAGMLSVAPMEQDVAMTARSLVSLKVMPMGIPLGVRPVMTFIWKGNLLCISMGPFNTAVLLAAADKTRKVMGGRSPLQSKHVPSVSWKGRGNDGKHKTDFAAIQ